jgi:hypothetical protein
MAHIIPLQRNTAIVQLIAGAVMISFSGVWVKISHVTPTISAFYRVLFGGIFLLAAAWCANDYQFRSSFNLIIYH